jgi:aquaporin Z
MKENIFSKIYAEFFGTMVLVLMGCGSAVIAGANGTTGIGLLGIAFAFGLSVIAMAYTIGHISGCHINPAISVVMMLVGRMPARESAAYIVAQILGALAGAGILMLIVSGRPGYSVAQDGLGQNGYGAFSPGHYSLLSGFIAETIFTTIFLMVVLGATSTKNIYGGFAGIAIGLCLVLIHITGIMVTGVSVNPARSIGPALLVGGDAISQLWMFIVAPILGSVLSAFLWCCLLEKN